MHQLAAIALSLLLLVAAAPAAVTCSEELAAVLRATVLPLLAALPPAAAPTRFASLHSDGAFARGFCFGDSATPPSDSDCVRCLSDAARNLTAGCGATSRRASILSQGCSLSEYLLNNLQRVGDKDDEKREQATAIRKIRSSRVWRFMLLGGIETNIVIASFVAIHKYFPRLLVKNEVRKPVKIKIIGEW
ncbi:hypothetical protein TRIUR3_09496 [Triticum urartu]|uniref:Uncharacterized protein n=1 Tax=Triticum urartu TaxID=4572 RepID=M7YFY0_TRIUA|nr:hypothetical protein TRIUR3_09496 [Triticum urartu]